MTFIIIYGDFFAKIHNKFSNMKTYIKIFLKTNRELEIIKYLNAGILFSPFSIGWKIVMELHMTECRSCTDFQYFFL